MGPEKLGSGKMDLAAIRSRQPKFYKGIYSRGTHVMRVYVNGEGPDAGNLLRQPSKERADVTAWPTKRSGEEKERRLHREEVSCYGGEDSAWTLDHI